MWALHMEFPAKNIRKRPDKGEILWKRRQQRNCEQVGIWCEKGVTKPGQFQVRTRFGLT